jgi:hypothetical protein
VLSRRDIDPPGTAGKRDRTTTGPRQRCHGPLQFVRAQLFTCSNSRPSKAHQHDAVRRPRTKVPKCRRHTLSHSGAQRRQRPKSTLPGKLARVIAGLPDPVVMPALRPKARATASLAMRRESHVVVTPMLLRDALVRPASSVLPSRPGAPLDSRRVATWQLSMILRLIHSLSIGENAGCTRHAEGPQHYPGGSISRRPSACGRGASWITIRPQGGSAQRRR